jgi:hypothetical protein
MSSPQVSGPPPPPREWTPQVPTEGPLAGTSRAPDVPVLPPTRTIAAPGPSRSRKFLPLIIGVALLIGLGVAAKFTVLDSGNAPGEQEVADAFTPVEGLTYTKLPSDLVDQARSLIDSNPEASEAISSFDIRQVNQGGAPAGAVMIFGVDPEVMGDAFREGFTTGFQGSAGGTSLQETTVAGTEVISVTPPFGGTGSIFFDEADGLIFFVQGSDQSVADKLTKALIEGNL